MKQSAMNSLNDILDNQPRSVALEAIYLGSHVLTCSTRAHDHGVGQNSALSEKEAERAIALADKIASWFVATERKPVDQLGPHERQRLARKLASYRRHHLMDHSASLQQQARQMLDRLTNQAV